MGETAQTDWQGWHDSRAVLCGWCDSYRKINSGSDGSQPGYIQMLYGYGLINEEG